VAQSRGCKIGTVRGGSFDDPVKNAVPGVRQPVPAKQRQFNIGFRVSRDGT
jgi:formylglycine-generating enzyme required for sulfatase activity